MAVACMVINGAGGMSFPTRWNCLPRFFWMLHDLAHNVAHMLQDVHEKCPFLASFSEVFHDAREISFSWKKLAFLARPFLPGHLCFYPLQFQFPLVALVPGQGKSSWTLCAVWGMRAACCSVREEGWWEAPSARTLRMLGWSARE